jgi:hypothetical protein
MNSLSYIQPVGFGTMLTTTKKELIDPMAVLKDIVPVFFQT